MCKLIQTVSDNILEVLLIGCLITGVIVGPLFVGIERYLNHLERQNFINAGYEQKIEGKNVIWVKPNKQDVPVE